MSGPRVSEAPVPILAAAGET